MLTPTERTSLAISKFRPTTSMLGTYVGPSGVYAVVNIGDQTVTVANVGQYLPQPGDSVQLESRGGNLAMTGPSAPKPATATVTATGSPKITVTDSLGNSYDLGFLPTYTPNLGDVVSINWFSGTVEGVPTQLLPVNVPATATSSGGNAFDKQFQAIGSGSFGTRWFSNNVFSSDSNTGAWFYGNQINDTLSNTAVITSVEIHVSIRDVIASGTSNVGHHASPSQPAGNVTVTGTSAVQLVNGWNRLPTTIGDYLKANYGGIGIAHGHYLIFQGTQADPALSGRLRIRGTQ